MTLQIIYISSLLIGFFVIIAISEILLKQFNVSSEYTRKVAHIIGTLVSLCLIFIITSHWYVFLLELIVFLILFIGKNKGTFKSIDSVSRKTGGSYLLPVAIYLVFMISSELNNTLIFILPMLILGISDPLAGIFGVYFEAKTSKITINNYVFEKTIVGSSVFFASALLISIATLLAYDYELMKVFTLSIVIAGTTTIVEILSIKGSDNVTVPLITILLLYSLI